MSGTGRLRGVLERIVGTDHVLADSAVKLTYERDWTGRFGAPSLLVVRPGDTAQVGPVLSACAEAGVAVVPQGGNTGLVGGGVPAGGEVVLSLARMRALSDVESASRQVTAQAGVTLAALQTHARAAGFDFGVDLAARDSATVGGLIATNAGGVRVLRHGSMKSQVVGIEAVLPDGSTVRRLEGLEKDGSGYDLSTLLAGSEGTLAVITAARLRLTAREGHTSVAVLALESVDGALAALRALRESLSLTAAELFFPEGVALVCQHTGLPPLFECAAGVYLLVEVADGGSGQEPLLSQIELLDGLVDARVASDPSTRRALWSYRERHSEAINAEGLPCKLDVAVPLQALATLVKELPGVVAASAPGARTIVFGHINEGNLHVNVLGADAEHARVTDAVLRLVASLQGSISSEHGVGRAKAKWLHLTRSPAEISAMRSIKRAFDPNVLLNPGVLLPKEATDALRPAGPGRRASAI